MLVLSGDWLGGELAARVCGVTSGRYVSNIELDFEQQLRSKAAAFDLFTLIRLVFFFNLARKKKKQFKHEKKNPFNKVKPHVVEVTLNVIFNPQRGGQAEAFLTLNFKPKRGQPPENFPGDNTGPLHPIG